MAQDEKKTKPAMAILTRVCHSDLRTVITAELIVLCTGCGHRSSGFRSREYPPDIYIARLLPVENGAARHTLLILPLLFG